MIGIYFYYLFFSFVSVFLLDFRFLQVFLSKRIVLVKFRRQTLFWFDQVRGKLTRLRRVTIPKFVPKSLI